jgi:hypothetical protein
MLNGPYNSLDRLLDSHAPPAINGPRFKRHHPAINFYGELKFQKQSYYYKHVNTVVGLIECILWAACGPEPHRPGQSGRVTGWTEATVCPFSQQVLHHSSISRLYCITAYRVTVIIRFNALTRVLGFVSRRNSTIVLM